MLRKTEFMLSDSFEVSGEWWLSNNPALKLRGRFTYSPDSIELEVDGCFDDLAASDLAATTTKFQSHESIQGVSSDGQKFTLLKCYASSISTTTNYDVLHIITGKHVGGMTDLKVNAATFYCRHLEAYLGQQLLKFESDGEGEALKACSVTYKQPPTIKSRIESISTTLEIKTSVTWTPNPNEHSQKLRARSHIALTPDSPKNLSWFLERSTQFCHFLNLVTEEVASPTGFKVFVEGDAYPGWYLYQTGKRIERSESNAPLLLFYHGHLHDQFETMLNNWFSASETLLDSIYLMMDAQRTVGHSTSGRFLLLAHAVEVISRATTSSEYMPANEYEGVIQAMNSAIPTGVKSDHRMSLKSRIKYGNEFALHKRIKLLLESLTEEARKIVCVDVGKFSRGIADTRNYYTHFTDELRPKALPAVPMYWASEKLSFLMRIELLRYLGIAEDTIVKQLNGHHRIGQRIRLSKEHLEVVATVRKKK